MKAEVAAGTYQAAGEAQQAASQPEQREALAAVFRGGAHSGSAFPPATALGVRRWGWVALGQVIRKTRDSLPEAGTDAHQRCGWSDFSTK